MPIEIRYGPSAAAAGQLGLEAGRGFATLRERDRADQLALVDREFAEREQQRNLQLYGIERGFAQDVWGTEAQQGYGVWQTREQQQYGREMADVEQRQALERMGYGAELEQERMGYDATLQNLLSGQAFEREYPMPGTEGWARTQAPLQAGEERWVEQQRVLNPLEGEPFYERLVTMPAAVQDAVIKRDLYYLGQAERQKLDRIIEFGREYDLPARQTAGAIAAEIGTPLQMMQAGVLPSRDNRVFRQETLQDGTVQTYWMDENKKPVAVGTPQSGTAGHVLVQDGAAYITQPDGRIDMKALPPDPVHQLLRQYRASTVIDEQWDFESNRYRPRHWSDLTPEERVTLIEKDVRTRRLVDEMFRGQAQPAPPPSSVPMQLGAGGGAAARPRTGEVLSVPTTSRRPADRETANIARELLTGSLGRAPREDEVETFLNAQGMTLGAGAGATPAPSTATQPASQAARGRVTAKRVEGLQMIARGRMPGGAPAPPDAQRMAQDQLRQLGIGW